MNTLAKSMLAAVAAGGLLAGCATYDYGYGYTYDQPYYYGYNYGYDYGPYYYDYGPYYYGAPYYAPSVGFGFTYRDHGHHYHSERRHANYNGARGHRSTVARSTVTRPTVTHAPSHNNVAAARSHPRPVAPAPTGANRGYAPNSLMRAEQQ